MTEASIPSAARRSAASGCGETMTPVATMVRSRARAADGGHAERDALGALGHVAARAVEQLVLEHDDGVGVVDGGEQQALGVGRRCAASRP